jgi:hypothetical protein
MEATKWLKPLVCVSRLGDSASVQAFVGHVRDVPRWHYRGLFLPPQQAFAGCRSIELLVYDACAFENF